MSLVLAGAAVSEQAGHAIVIHDTRYLDGAGILLAWDFRISREAELASYLFRAPVAGDGYFLHSVSSTVEPHEAVTIVDLDRARSLYQEMRVRILPVSEAFPEG